MAPLFTTALLRSGVSALAPRSPEDATTFYAANAWNPTSEGFQCLTVNEDDTNVWFNAPWLWVGDDDNVHSYPHVKFQHSKLPLPLAEITSMRLTGSWMMTAGSLDTETPKFSSSEWDENKSSLDELGTKANAAFDMFLDADSTNSTDSVLAGIELMIWIGSVGEPWPLKTKTLGTQNLGDREFTLYYGKNQRDHHVFTWVPDKDVDDITEFDEDISPLLEYIWRNGLIANSTYLGVVEFGRRPRVMEIALHIVGYDLVGSIVVIVTIGIFLIIIIIIIVVVVVVVVIIIVIIVLIAIVTFTTAAITTSTITLLTTTIANRALAVFIASTITETIGIASTATREDRAVFLSLAARFAAIPPFIPSIQGIKCPPTLSIILVAFLLAHNISL
ncbi:glycosyl transferase [Fusarium mundagurra]|uniref:Glycosyl transferase n=1 Tax=Fusarium mundagurra TaxID=1567541 RepID=A0A8H6DAA9_9HYPO|nr:glycosyl transferase [Fusarium mundagurra]